jgi:hypothetical protein
VSPSDAAIIADYSRIATAGITVIQTDYAAYKASGATTDLQKLQAAIAAVQTNLQTEFLAAKISDPGTQAKITAWVNLVSSSITAVVAALPQLEPSGIQAQTRVVTLVTPEYLQARWANEVCAGNKKCGKLVRVPLKYRWHL